MIIFSHQLLHPQYIFFLTKKTPCMFDFGCERPSTMFRNPTVFCRKISFVASSPRDEGGVAKKWRMMTRGREGVTIPPKIVDVIYEQPLIRQLSATIFWGWMNKKPRLHIIDCFSDKMKPRVLIFTHFYLFSWNFPFWRCPNISDSEGCNLGNVLTRATTYLVEINTLASGLAQEHLRKEASLN